MGNPAIDFPWEKRCVSGDTIVKNGPCVLHSLVFNGMTATGVVNIYDNIDNSGGLIASLIMDSAAPQTSVQPINFDFDCEMETGIYIDYTAGFVGNFTALWK